MLESHFKNWYIKLEKLEKLMHNHHLWRQKPFIFLKFLRENVDCKNPLAIVLR